MRKGKNLRKHWIAILCIALAVCSAGCKSRAGALARDAQGINTALAPPLPAAPELEPVAFEDRGGGLWLAYAEYRKLERNVIALREYAALLEIVARFYAQEK